MTKTAKPRVQASVARRLPRATPTTIGLQEREELLGPESNGILMTPEEFDALEVSDVQEGWFYELINGVFIVSPIPFWAELDSNEELGYLLRRYRDDHPQGRTLDATGSERYIFLENSRRRADRVIFAGLKRLPYRKENPTIAVEFVSQRRRDRILDYETKRDEYMRVRIKEYWIIDRFMQTMTVFRTSRGKVKMQVLQKDEVYQTDLLPGFELPLARLFQLAAQWNEQPEEPS